MLTTTFVFSASDLSADDADPLQSFTKLLTPLETLTTLASGEQERCKPSQAADLSRATSRCWIRRWEGRIRLARTWLDALSSADEAAGFDVLARFDGVTDLSAVDLPPSWPLDRETLLGCERAAVEAVAGALIKPWFNNGEMELVRMHLQDGVCDMVQHTAYEELARWGISDEFSHVKGSVDRSSLVQGLASWSSSVFTEAVLLAHEDY